MKKYMINWGGNGPVLHLAHANSFHPGTYVELIELLKKDYEVHSFLFKPFHAESKPSDIRNWNLLRDEMIAAYDEMGWKNVIGVGHSLGSTITMMAAIKRPDLFSKLVIIEPPCIDRIFFDILAITPYPLAKHLVPPSKIALKRRHKWPSKEEAFTLLRKKRTFQGWSDKTLEAYVESGLYKDEEGVFRLKFTKEWESKIYCTIENPYRLFPKIKVPSLCIRAEESDVINEKNWQRWQSLQNGAKFLSIANTGHLLPMEDPGSVAQHINEFALS